MRSWTDGPSDARNERKGMRSPASHPLCVFGPWRRLAACWPLLLPVQVAALEGGTLTGTVVGAESVPLAAARFQVVGAEPIVVSDRDGQVIAATWVCGCRECDVWDEGYGE